MSLLSRLLVLSREMSSVVVLSTFAFFSIGTAQAVTIDFDDLNYADFAGTEEELMTPLTNEYESLGVMFGGGAYLSNFSWRSLNSISGPGFSFHFIGELPTYVSMYAGSVGGYKVGFRARRPDGSFEDRLTDGGVRGASWELSTTYTENQFVSFYIPEGISSIEVGSQGSPYMDDLTFSVSVPESETLMLFCLGILIMCLRGKSLKKIPAEWRAFV